MNYEKVFIYDWYRTTANLTWFCGRSCAMGLGIQNTNHWCPYRLFDGCVVWAIGRRN